jgi:protoheme IX farnesyltransferase
MQHSLALHSRQSDTNTTTGSLTTARYLALFVMILGAYTRLKDAGLGCPDWPTCYGNWLAPLDSSTAAIKAWIEMLHRYVAGIFGAVTLYLAWQYRQAWNLLLLCLVAAQAILGMLTVTALLHPVIVILHLLGGLAILSVLWWVHFAAQCRAVPKQVGKPVKLAVLACLCLLGLQISLGGWVSANYAALVCSDFPQCQGHWWPPLDLRGALFAIPLENTARVTVQMLHRLGALVLSLALLSITRYLLALQRRIAIALLLVLVLQVLLGINNIYSGLPLANALLHHAGALLLWLLLLRLACPLLQPSVQRGAQYLHAYWQLCKPRVVALIMFTAITGMAMAGAEYWQQYAWASLGIALMAAAAAAANQVLEVQIDRKMRRTAERPLVLALLPVWGAMAFILGLSSLAYTILYTQVNVITAHLTLLSLLLYSGLYTVFLKTATPQNIVIGGISGALPPLLGWCAITGSIAPEALLLALIIFVWTPPHFWALAINRLDDYQETALPMLPNTHGIAFTKLFIFLYTILLLPVSLLPYLIKMSGLLYATIALLFTCIYIGKAGYFYKKTNLTNRQEKQAAGKLFAYSIYYLTAIFTALLLDHYVQYT